MKKNFYIMMFFDKIRQLLKTRNIHKAVPLYALVPWAVFWNQGGNALSDRQELRITLTSQKNDCSKSIKTFRTAVAKHDTSRTKGLSNRRSPLERNQGMFFAFDEPGIVRFWMKDTYIPLSLLFFDANGVFLNKQELKVEANPAQPQKEYVSPPNTQFALEINPTTLVPFNPHQAGLCVYYK